MTLFARNELPEVIRRGLELGTSSGPGGRPEYGVLGEALAQVEVVLQDLGNLPPVLGNPSAVTDGYRIYLGLEAEGASAEHVAGLMLKATAVLVAVQSGDALLSSHVALVNPDQFGAEAPWQSEDKTVPCLLESLAPVYGQGADLLFQVVRQNRRANELLEPPLAPPSPSPKL